MRDMEWYVYVEDINGRHITTYNIFQHGRFMDDVQKIYKQYKDDFDIFSCEIQKSLRYYFWSKAEWEIILSDWPESKIFQKEKIDVYDQVMLNWDIFIRYVWEMAHARKVSKKTNKPEG